MKVVLSKLHLPSEILQQTSQSSRVGLRNTQRSIGHSARCVNFVENEVLYARLQKYRLTGAPARRCGPVRSHLPLMYVLPFVNCRISGIFGCLDKGVHLKAPVHAFSEDGHHPTFNACPLPWPVHVGQAKDGGT